MDKFIEILIKKFLTAAILLIGTFSIPSLKAVQYSHRFDYSHADNTGTAYLRAVVTFDDAAGVAQDDTSGLGNSIDTNFTTHISYIYRPVIGGTVYSLTTSDFSFYQLQKSTAELNFNGDPDLYSQLTNIQFTNSFGGSGPFVLTMNGEGGHSIQAVVPGETPNDFNLDSITQFPAPLPLLGILPAITSIRSLKKRYNSINKNN